MTNTVIIDANSIGHANHNATKLTVGDLEVQAVFGVVKSVAALAKAYPEWQIICLWDGKSVWRKELYPEYKENRAAKDEKQLAHKESYKRQTPIIRTALKLMGVRQLLVTSAEADDMAGLMSQRLSKSDSVLLVTGDQDWLQLVNPNVMWFDPIRDRKVGMGSFFVSTGYKTPEQFLDGKALRGDSSDNIKGVGGIGEKGAPEFLAEYGSVDRFFQLFDEGKTDPKMKMAYKRLASPEGRAIFERNRKLMNLLDVPIPPKDDVQVIAPDLNKEGLRRLFEKLAFASILGRFDEFIEPFESQSPLPMAA